MKKLLAILLVLAMMLSTVLMASCAKDEPEKPDDPQTPDGPNDPEKPDDPKDPEQPDDPGKTDDPTASEEDQKAADKVLALIEKIPDITEDNYVTSRTKIEKARKAYDELTDDQKKLLTKDQVRKLTRAESAYKELKAAAELAESLTINKIVTATPTVDGVIDDCYRLGSALVLSQAAVAGFTADQKAAGGSIVGDTSLTDGADTHVTLRFAVDDEYLYICEERGDLSWNFTASSFRQPYTGDGSLIWFTKGGNLLCGLQWNAGTQESPTEPVIGLFTGDNQAESEEKTEWEKSLKFDDSGYTCVLEVKAPLSELGLTKDDFEKKNVGVTFCSVDIINSEFDGDTSKLWAGMGYQMQYPGVNNWNKCERFYTVAGSNYNTIAAGSADVDGVLDDIYANSSEIRLNQDVCKAFTDEQKAAGASMVGDTSIGDSAYTDVVFRFAVDREYLYILEQRDDLTPVYSAKDFRQPYAGDGSLIWFVLKGELKCGIQWNRATQESAGEPVFGLFEGDNQGESTEMGWERRYKYDDSGLTCTLETKIPLADLGLTYEDFQNADVAVTFCTVDIVDETFDGDTSKLWTGKGYQMQYPGVNHWADAYRLVLK